MASRRNAKAFDDAPRAKLDKATLRKAMRVFRYLKPYRGWFALGLGALLITSLLACSSLCCWANWLMLRGAMSGAQKRSALSASIPVALTLLAVFAAQAFFGFFRIYLFSYITENMLATTAA